MNSMLVPSQHLAEPNTPSDRQVEFSRGINSSGSGLLNLINDILDLSKIEDVKVMVEMADMPFVTIRDATDRSFRHVAEATSPPFHAQFGDGLPHSMESDPKQQQQSLKSLISNAVKVTSRGNVDVTHHRSWLQPPPPSEVAALEAAVLPLNYDRGR